MISFSRRLTLLAAVAGCALTAHADIAGFGDGTGFTANGGASISSGTATLTTRDTNPNPVSQSRSVFFNTPQQFGVFTATFTYQNVFGSGGEGFVFTLQNDSRGSSATSNDGGLYGYGSSNNGATAIAPSIAVEFNISVNGGGSKTGYNTNGTVNTSTMTATTPGVDLAGTNPIQVSIVYDGSIITETLTDTTTNGVYSQTYSVGNLASVLGAGAAYVGFTGGSGGTVSTQQISAFSYAPVPEPSEWALMLLGGATLALAVRRAKTAARQNA